MESEFVSCKYIAEKIQSELKSFLGNKKAVIGISGGVDSAVIATLCVNAVGKDRVVGVQMPYENQSTKDGTIVMNHLGIEDGVINIKPIVDCFINELFMVDDNRLTNGNVRARIRMTILYAIAGNNNGCVIGTGNKTELMLGYFCYDDKTRALTPDGLKDRKQLKKGDTVFSLNLKTKQLEEKKVLKVHNFDFDGNLVRGKNAGIDFKVTSNHRMVLQNPHNSGDIFLEKLDKYLENHIHLNIPFANGWIPKIIKDKLYGMDINDIMYLYGLFIGDGCCSHYKIRHKLKTLKLKRNNRSGRFEKILNPINKIVYYNAFGVHFCIPKNNKNNAWNKLTTILTKYGIKWHKASFGIKSILSDNKLFKIFSKCGYGAHNKIIPKFLLKYPSENLQYLYQGLIDSDGDKMGNFYTSSQQLAVQFVELCFKIGKSARITNIKARQSIYKGKLINSGPSYYVGVCGKIKSRTISKHSIKEEYYNGSVWCPEIEDHENLIVERNGYFYFCGNTKYGDGGCDIEPIGNLYKTEVFELAKYLGVPEPIITKSPSAELWGGQTDEGEIGMTYKEMDQILKGMEGTGLFFDRKKLEELYGKEKVDVIDKRVEASSHKREMPKSILF
jgi:NH3-dependent NAD+ synthetase